MIDASDFVTVWVAVIGALAVIAGVFLGGAFTLGAAKKAAAAARERAKEDRRQNRIYDAYVTIQIYVDKWAQLAA